MSISGSKGGPPVVNTTDLQYLFIIFLDKTDYQIFSVVLINMTRLEFLKLLIEIF